MSTESRIEARDAKAAGGVVAEARAILAKMTPGEWAVEDPMENSLSIVPANTPTYEWWFIADCSFPEEDDHNFTSSEVQANAYGIVWMRNNLAAILDALAAAQAREAELREALRPFANVADRYDPANPDGSFTQDTFPLRYYRRARAALRKDPQQ